MLALSFAVNLAMLLPLPTGFAMQAGQIAVVFGPATDARRILVSLYATIAVASVLGLGLIIAGRADLALQLGVTLFSMQIIYKVLTLPLVGWDSPVVKTNLAVVAVHAATLITVLTARS